MSVVRDLTCDHGHARIPIYLEQGVAFRSTLAGLLPDEIGRDNDKRQSPSLVAFTGSHS
jgi:hypothetical protein